MILVDSTVPREVEIKEGGMVFRKSFTEETPFDMIIAS